MIYQMKSDLKMSKKVLIEVIGETSMGMSHTSLIIANMFRKQLKEAKKKC